MPNHMEVGRPATRLHKTRIDPSTTYPDAGVSGVYWSRYSYPFGITVNVHGRRFIDEGETWRGLTYAKTGRAILCSTGRDLAFQIFDADQRCRGLIRGYEDATGFKSNSLRSLANNLGISDVSTFLETVRQFNASVQEGEIQRVPPRPQINFRHHSTKEQLGSPHRHSAI